MTKTRIGNILYVENVKNYMQIDSVIHNQAEVEIKSIARIITSVYDIAYLSKDIILEAENGNPGSSINQIGSHHSWIVYSRTYKTVEILYAVHTNSLLILIARKRLSDDSKRKIELANLARNRLDEYLDNEP